MQIEDKKKLAEKHFESANSRAATAAKTGFAFLLALVLLWKSNIEPVVPQLHQAAEQAKTVRAFGKYLQSTRGDKQKFLDKRLQTTQNYNAEFGSLAAKLKKTEVDFKVPGFDPFKVPLKYAALVFNTLFLSIICYMLVARSEIRTLLARGARLTTESSGEDQLIRPNVVFFIPWWIAPLPQTSGSKVTHGQIVDLIEWRTRHRFFVIALLVFLLVLCAVQIRVCLISLLSAYSFSQIESTGSAFTVSAASVFLTALTLACATAWLLPGRVADELFGEEVPARSRRNSLKTIGSALILAGLTTALALKYPLTFIRPIRTPRFVAKTKGKAAFVNLAAGFYLNRGSRRIQYVSHPAAAPAASAAHSSAGRLVGVRTSIARAPKPKNFDRIPADFVPARLDISLINRSARTPIVENAANDMRKLGRMNEACALLLSTVTYDLTQVAQRRGQPYDVRLCYLLARFSILAKDETYLTRMIDAITQNGMLERFQKPIASWINPDKRWRKRLRYEK